MSTPFDLVLGRKTYDVFAAYWPHAPEEAGAKPPERRHEVRPSRGRPTLEWETSVLIERDAADGIAALKNEDGSELQVHGSGNLIQTLMRHNLVGGATPVGHEDGAGLGGAEQRSKGFGHPSARRLAPDGHKRVGASEP